MNKTNLVYFSAAGTTRSVATTFAKELQGEIAEYDLLLNPQRQAVEFGAGETAVFAMPVYSGRIPTLCSEFLKQFRGQNTPAVAIVVYGNREYEDALLELCDTLRANGFVPIAAAAFVAQHCIFPAVATGRPDTQDQEEIRAFAAQCRALLASYTGSEALVVKGNFPYREYSASSMKPTGDDNCNACGICVEICPVQAIPPDAPRQTEESRCITCTACIWACPQRARGFHTPQYVAASQGFAERNANRKESELFYAGR